ncbi:MULTISPECIES: DUF4920 domain-containing protein [unclassified Cellulophaga]|uniref:DUF4920 domain-containing protein n=1 Tax=unclassified Cellulophaga TaxID=2634405 RepID=UPI0026E2C73A|nr:MULTISPECIES: DUF4920 domain-containing protein [unclassified Cellulophaga]MDO6492930.1 DUF4920 domain-containing protein [Cellulophaga sp. 2_MG-2023]MDO6496446.1 DUF4920 domain-containing protein [Cellulophaga sp. 3_MG-2023]
MKSFNILLVVILLFMSCKEAKKETVVQEPEQKIEELASFGEKITVDNAKVTKEMAVVYHNLAVTDTVTTKFKGKVLDVCQSKGCWMKLDLGDGEQAMVKFKDYGFFMPKDIAGKEVVINGKAFIEQMSVDEQQHYAEDGGATKEEIAQITEPKKTYRFEADGVLLKE